ncbi:polysaccharide deacetylase family protein [Gaoshiqia sp. Z1-71]|uniref:polysaccharide deacetylase family protein n=1 Tax=Gaoshiqia hydrogeniformans TaxID=3290090 RepID=UPI003BF7E348
MQRFDPRIRLPQFLTRYFPGAIWRIPSAGNQVFLTFDDGPVPEVTPWVLDLLKKEQIKACFFCVGENVMKYPEIYRRILEEGHRTGNHTFNHLQGLKTPDADYLRNVEKAAGYIDSRFFRPPHGWMKRSQFRQLSKQYQVVMWDLISRDYRKDLTPEAVVRNVTNFVRPGSVIIFHDSYKAKTNLYPALPEVIRRLKMKGYQFGDWAQV